MTLQSSRPSSTDPTSRVSAVSYKRSSHSGLAENTPQARRIKISTNQEDRAASLLRKRRNPARTNTLLLQQRERTLMATHIHRQYADHRAVRRALKKEPLTPKAQENYAAYDHIARFGNSTNHCTLGWSEVLREDKGSHHPPPVEWNKSNKVQPVPDPIRMEQRKEVVRAMLESRGTHPKDSPPGVPPRGWVDLTPNKPPALRRSSKLVLGSGVANKCLRLEETTRRRLEDRIQTALGLSSPTRHSYTHR